jgi:hypothetical protein
MAYGHRKREDEELAWADTREAVQLALRSILRRASNIVLDRYFNEQFLPALERGEILELDATQRELRGLLAEEITKQRLELEAGDATDQSV